MYTALPRLNAALQSYYGTRQCFLCVCVCVCLCVCVLVCLCVCLYRLILIRTSQEQLTLQKSLLKSCKVVRHTLPGLGAGLVEGGPGCSCQGSAKEHVKNNDIVLLLIGMLSLIILLYIGSRQSCQSSDVFLIEYTLFYFM